MTKYRIYIDEVGNSDLGSSANPNHRFLSLTGIVLAIDYAGTVVYPQLESLKARYFASHPDEPAVLHRKELVNAMSPFSSLRSALESPLRPRIAHSAHVLAIHRHLCLS